MPRDTKHISTQGTDNKKKQTKSDAKPPEVVWGGFINIKVDDHTKLVFEEWYEHERQRIWEFVQDALADDLKFSVSWDRENQCYLSNLIGAGVVGSNERYCLPARAGRLDESFALLLFKHVVMCEKDWGQYRPATQTVNNWG